MSELSNLFDLPCCSCKSSENCSDVGTLLHGDDPELVLFIDPNKEGLLVVVENTSALWPVAVETTGIEEAITLFEQEVIVNQLLLLLWSHGSKRVEGTGKLSFETVAGLDNFLFNLISLFLSDTRAKRICCQVTANSDTSGFDH